MDLEVVVWGCMDWIDLAQDRYRWRALVKAIMNLRVPLSRGISCLAKALLASQEVTTPWTFLVNKLL
jgi:hypothetical protein